jgi:UDP-N-acetyl-2-amino-2-deoxyglucuronate dehydrogenase
MKNKQINIAIVGCGRVAYKHFSAIDELNGEAKLVATCDIDETRAPDKGVPFYPDYHKMMAAHSEIDLVHVLVPTGLHARVVIDLAKYGRHILTEKPMALSVADCSAMINACEEKSAKLFVVYQNRYNDAVRAMRQAFDDGRFGKIVMGTVRLRWCRHQQYYAQDKWHGTWAMDGGVMSQQASHHLDLLQYFLGEVESVQCQSTSRLLDIEAEDTAAAILRFKSGALGIFEATVAARPRNLEGSLSLLGEKGTVEAAGIAVNEIKTWEFEDKQNLDEFIHESASRQVPNVYGLGHTMNIYDVIRNLRDNDQIASLCDGYGGRENIKILTALYESAACNGKLLPPGAPMLHCPLGNPEAANMDKIARSTQR